MLAVRIKFEVGVQFTRHRRSIIVGSEYNEKTSGRNRDVGQGPLVQIQFVIGQCPTQQRDRRVGHIAQFDPVRVLPVYIQNAGAV